MPFWKRTFATDDHYRQVLMQGQRCMQQQQPAAAVPFFEQCVALQPTNGHAWSSLGQALLDLNRLSEALTVLEHAVRHTPNDVAAWYNYGLTQRRLGAFTPALASVEQALRLNPRAWLAWYEKGVVLCHNQHPEQIESITEQHGAALNAFSQAVALQPDDPYSWLWRGRLAWRIACSAQARTRAGVVLCPSARLYCDAALESFAQVLRLLPDDPSTLFEQGRALKDFGEYASARAVYCRLTSLTDHPNDWYQLALINDVLGDSAAVRASLARAFVRDPALRAAAADDFAVRHDDGALQALLTG